VSELRRIEADGVVLRDIVAGDGEAIYGYLTADPEIAKWTRIPWPYTRGHLADFMALVGRARPSRTDIVLAVTEPGDDRIAGCIGIHRVGARSIPRSAMLPDEIGYWLGAEFRNRGLATSAVRLLSSYALGELGVGAINLQTKVGNVPSQHVATKAGYRFVARVMHTEVDDDLSDHDRFVMTRDDYERANGPLTAASADWGGESVGAVSPLSTGPASAP
jgi:RimJ/RimL family protein N-acetyltransferase